MSSRIETERASTTWMIAVTATIGVAAGLRFYGLNSSLWFDEIVTLVDSARRPILEIVTYFPDVNVHPFYSVLAHISLESFGESAWALRLPACLFGIASVAMVYGLGSQFSERREAWAGAAILAVSYQHIWFSQNARGYTMMGFFALLATYYLLRAARSARPFDYLCYALASAAGVYTHLTMAFVIAGHAVVVMGGRAVGWHATRQWALKPLMAAWTGAAALSLALYAPYMSGLLQHFGAAAPKQAAQVATGHWAISEALRNFLSGAGVLGALAAGLAAAIGALSFLRRDALAFALLVVPAFVAGVSIVGLGQPVRPRFFFFIAGAAAIFAGRGAAIIAATAMRQSRPSTAGVVAVTLVVAVASAFALPRNYRVPKQDFDGAVRYLETEVAAGAVIGTAGPACFAFERYYQKADWPCLRSIPDLQQLLGIRQRVLVVHTLADYIDDPDLRERIQKGCPEVRRFPGTLGGGDMIVCDPRAAGAP
jgi:4-amino-4-deoxy-L-arabinose transferase-like glycosyltransferase